MSLSNIDSLLNTIELTPDSLQGQVEDVSRETIESASEESTSTPSDSYGTEESSTESAPVVADKEESTDDYGQPIEKKERVYTQAELDAKLNEVMRDRNARGEWAKQEALRQQQLKEQPTTNNSDETNDNWEHQLESFVEQTLTKREQKQQQEQWQKQEQQRQAEFEVKFNSGAAKYADFEQVVIGKSLTPKMIIATRGMSDPAAFIYAAAKTQANELDRISKIGDQMAQAVELGKLEERMRKGKASTSNAPKPIESVKGDYTDKKIKPRNIDDIIRQEDAKRLKGRR